ncbi:Low-density lipoprotein receptor-related protein 4 [Eumeta japonica]|uniref:Low-density lipoprotein receptor-related protein 4 n=1 Tax=Eumeta variegata TaxID=151549 RepID=A0A4C1TSL9_EUMVA|nr:Low-density lipoprotein receptor-related protein 4 [Eumeta japonica]
MCREPFLRMGIRPTGSEKEFGREMKVKMNVIPVESIKSAVALDWDHNSNSIFWTDVEKDTINKAFLNGSHQTVIVNTNLISPAGLAYDWITNKLYWTDAGTNRIEAANTDGSMRTLLAWQNIDKPRDIVVDPEGGRMYWSDWGSAPCIERADMDGGNRQRIIMNRMTWPNGLALDLAHGRIYWTDGGNRTIEYANLDGTGRVVLIGSQTGELLPHPFGLDLYGDEVFWTDWDTQSIQAANKLTGKNRRTLGAGVAGLMDVRVFHKERIRKASRCGANNGGCSHLCLLKPNAFSCACPTGIKLQADGRTCRNVPTNYLIFAHRVDIRVVSLDMPYLVDVVLPLPPLKNALGVDVDRTSGAIYWTDTAEKRIQRGSRDGKHIETVINTGLHTADGIVIDSIGRKASTRKFATSSNAALIIIQIYWTDGGRNSIEVAELDGKNRKVLIWTGLDSPRAIALHYKDGYMFWSDWGTKAKIERADMDGKNRRIVVDNNIKWPNGLAIDRIEQRLYWNDAKVLSIESSDFKGNDRRTVMSNVPYPYGIVVVDKYLYWTDWKTKALHRANKANGKDAIVLRENLEGLMDIRAVEHDNETENVCGTNNGGCSHLCLRSSRGYSCACPTGLQFVNKSDADPKVCQSHPENFLIFATRGSVSMMSLDTPEHWDVTLAIKGVKNSIAVDFHWEQRLIFYTDVDLDFIKAVNMENMSDTNVIVKTRLNTPNGLAVDWIADNIYWTDNEYKVLEVARLDGSSRKAIITGLAEPRALALIPRKGYIYWSDWGETPCIERALLDGSQRKIIVNQDLGFPNGLTIDYEEKRLYWTDALKDRIDTSDLDGQRRVQLIPDAKNPFGMTQFKDYIYWTDWYKKAVMRADKITGKNVTALRTDLEMTMEIKAVSSAKQQGWNPCKDRNGGCSHLCLYRDLDYVCACPDESDGRPCTANAIVISQPRPPATNAESPASTSHMVFVIIALSVFSVILMAVLIFVIARRRKTRGQNMKETYRDTSGHISFPNPNYSCATGGPNNDSKSNRFPGIFKYDRTQERVTNVYMAEGKSLLPPPPPPPHRPPPPRPSSRDDFEPVTLHPFA